MEPEAALSASTSTLATASPSATDSPDAAPPLSKSAAKRLLRQQKFEQEKPLRRAREKAMKKEKAAQKRKLVELGVIEKPLTKRQQMQQRGPRRPFNARIVIDVGFDDLMNEKEVKSMTAQLSFCHSANRNSVNPVPILVSSLSGRLKLRLEENNQGSHQSWKNVEFWEDSYDSLWREEGQTASSDVVHDPEGETPTLTSTSEVPTNGASREGVEASAPKKDLVTIGVKRGKEKSKAKREDVIYLTADSPNTLTELEEGKSYILGGIVDRNRYKSLCYDKAVKSGISHAKLPIGEFLPDLPTRKVLTVNQVFEIMVKWIETRDWKEAMLGVMPSRKFSDEARVRGKDKKGKGGSEDGEQEEDEEDGEEYQECAVYEAVDEDEVQNGEVEASDESTAPVVATS
ncbi:hypothetical protein T439DRAFT_351887 [Meredithblackwellia eburnea MCA 4105]